MSLESIDLAPLQRHSNPAEIALTRRIDLTTLRLFIAVCDEQNLTRAARDHLLFTDTLDFDHIGLHAASSIYLRSQYAATQAGKSMRLRINVPGFDAVCRMVQANMGIGLIPDRAFEVVGAGMGLRSIRLRDEWAKRELRIVVRDAAHLSSTGRLVLDHLCAAERPAHKIVRADPT